MNKVMNKVHEWGVWKRKTWIRSITEECREKVTMTRKEERDDVRTINEITG